MGKDGDFFAAGDSVKVVIQNLDKIKEKVEAVKK